MSLRSPTCFEGSCRIKGFFGSAQSRSRVALRIKRIVIITPVASQQHSTAGSKSSSGLSSRSPPAAATSSRDDFAVSKASGGSLDSVLASLDETQQQTQAPQPVNVFAEIWNSYNSSLEKQPVRTKAGTSFVGFVLGDILAQRIGGEGPIEAIRCLRLGTYGLAVDGPLGHLWYKILDRNVCPDNPQGLKSVLLKTAADQLIWAPIMTCVFFAVLKTLEGHPELILSTIQGKLVQTIVANYVLWPAAHFINFRFVPSEQRIAYNNVISVAWNAYLSTLSHNAALDTTQLLSILDQATAALDSWIPEQVADGLSAVFGSSEALKGMQFDIPKSIDLKPTRTLLDWLPIVGAEKGI